MNKNFICNCLPIILFLLNLVEINNMMKKKWIIRIGVLLFGIIGGIILYFSRIGYQSTFEWVCIYVTQFYFFEFISVKSNDYFSKKFNTDKIQFNTECNEINKFYHYRKMRCAIIGVFMTLFVYSPLYEMVIIGSDSNLYLLSKINYTLVSISFIFLFFKANNCIKCD